VSLSQQNSQDPCQEDSIKSPGPADGDNGSTKPLNLIEIHDVRTDQGSQAPGNIGQGGVGDTERGGLE